MAGVGVSLGTLDLVRVDGRPCLAWCSHTTISRTIVFWEMRLAEEHGSNSYGCTVIVFFPFASTHPGYPLDFIKKK